MAEFIPRKTFRAFTGEVEDNNDPLMIGRVRVRAHGFHSQSKEDIPTEDLPWAFLTHPGSKRLRIPEVGEWVVGYFLDGEELQKPVVLGILPGIDEEPTTSRWARNEKTDDTSIAKTKANTTSLGDITEPDSPYAAEYPKNHVWETPGGHLIEADDTEGSERIHVYHMSGTFYEIHPDGSVVQKVQSDLYNVTNGNRNDLSQGSATEEVGGDLAIHLGGKYNLQNKAQSLKDLIDTLIDELIVFQTAGSPSNHTTSPTTITKLQKLKKQFGLLLQ